MISVADNSRPLFGGGAAGRAERQGWVITDIQFRHAEFISAPHMLSSAWDCMRF